MVSANFVNKSKRLSRLELRLNDLELDLIKNSAKILNKTTSDFIRFSVNHYIQNILNVDQSAIH